MCGIVGCIGKSDVKPFLITGLKRLEYRGYDSAGLCVLKNKEFDIKIRKFADFIFYKPFDLNEVTKELSTLTGTFN